MSKSHNFFQNKISSHEWIDSLNFPATIGESEPIFSRLNE